VQQCIPSLGQQGTSQEQHPSEPRRYVDIMPPSPIVVRRLILWYSQEERQKHATPPPSRPGSMYRKGSGEANVRFQNILQVMIDTPPASPRALSAEDLDRHRGQRTASPERQFACDGWCRTRQMSATPEHGDVVCWVSSHPSIPRTDPLVFPRYPSRLLTTAKFLGMQVRGTVTVSR
jgi:hypothetical protein